MAIRNNQALALSASELAHESLARPRLVDETRVRHLVDQHFDALYHALRRLGVPMGDLEDCTQEVFLVASGKLEMILPGRERAFLLGIAVRVASQARRKMRRFPFLWSDDAEDEAFEDPRMLPDEEMDVRRRRNLFVQIVKQLPEGLRSVFLLFEIEELTMVEIASAMDLPPGTVASRLRRAREEFSRIAARMVVRTEGGSHAR